MKLADLENPQFGTRIWDISPIQGEKEPILTCQNTQIFITMATRGLSETTCNDAIKLADPENPLWYQNLGIISYRIRVIANAAVRGPPCDVW